MIKKILLLIVLAGGVSLPHLKAQRHIVRASWSDATPLLIADLFVEGLSNAVTGASSEREDFKGMYTFGYRFKWSRFALGADVSYANLSQRVRLPGEQYTSGAAFSLREKGDYFMVMPALEFVYVKFPFVDVYTSMAAGYLFSEVQQTGLTEIGTSYLEHAQRPGGSSFAFQYNPVGLRFGLDRFAAFAELGIGFRGFVCLGLDYRF